MRALLLGLAASIAGGVVCTAVVQGQDNNPYSAARKSQGVTRNSSSNNSSANSPRPAATVEAPVSPPSVEIDPDSVSDTPQSVMKSAPPSDQLDRQSTSTQPTVKLAQRPAASDSDGLKAFQQRLAAVRKYPMDSVPNAGPVAPQIALPGEAGAPPEADLGPMNGPTPPNMPDIHFAQQPLAPTPISAPEPTPARRAEPAASVAPAPNAPVVAGPVPVARHIPMERDERPAQESIATEIPRNEPVAAKPEPVAPANNVLFSQQSPMLGVQTTGPRSVNVGKEANYVVTIVNAGQTAVQDLTISVKIPTWTDIVESKATNGAARPASSAAGEPLLWRLARLDAHSKEQLTLHLVPRESRPFDLAVQWTFSPVASQAMVEVKEPKLTMSLAGPKEVLYGQSKVYKLSLSNPGTGDAENVVLFLSPVDGGSGAPTRHDLGTIRTGESKVVEVELTARQAGTLQMKAAAMAEGNLRAEVAEEIVVHRAGLKLVATGPETKFTGTSATFKIQVKNPGNATAENILLAAMLPVGAKYLSSNGGQIIAEQNKVAWTIPTLGPGAEQELEVRCTLNSPGANRLQVVGSAKSEISDSTAVITNVEALADLKLEVIDPQGPIPVGEEATYEVHLKNRGTKTAENVDVAGYFSRGIEPISAQGATYDISSGQVVFRPIPSIAPGTELVLRVKARAEKAGNLVFRAEVVCPMAGAKLATEETTLFFGDNDRQPMRTAARTNIDGELRPAPASDRSPVPVSVKK